MWNILRLQIFFNWNFDHESFDTEWKDKKQNAFPDQQARIHVLFPSISWSVCFKIIYKYLQIKVPQILRKKNHLVQIFIDSLSIFLKWGKGNGLILFLAKLLWNEFFFGFYLCNTINGNNFNFLWYIHYFNVWSLIF